MVISRVGDFVDYVTRFTTSEGVFYCIAHAILKYISLKAYKNLLHTSFSLLLKYSQYNAGTLIISASPCRSAFPDRVLPPSLLFVFPNLPFSPFSYSSTLPLNHCLRLPKPRAGVLLWSYLLSHPPNPPPHLTTLEPPQHPPQPLHPLLTSNRPSPALLLLPSLHLLLLLPFLHLLIPSPPFLHPIHTLFSQLLPHRRRLRACFVRGGGSRERERGAEMVVVVGGYGCGCGIAAGWFCQMREWGRRGGEGVRWGCRGGVGGVLDTGTGSRWYDIDFPRIGRHRVRRGRDGSSRSWRGICQR